MLQVGEVARYVGQVLTDTLGHFEVVVDVLIGGLGPALEEIDERAVGGALVRLATAAERLDPLEHEIQAVLRRKHAIPQKRYSDGYHASFNAS